MKFRYSFCILRYVHDPATQEFVNIGVALYAPEANYLRAICTTSYARITSVFEGIDGQRFRQVSRYIQDQICAAGERSRLALPLGSAEGIEQVLAKILPPDDSSFQFSKAGVGVASNLDLALHDLYSRQVEHYGNRVEASGRIDEDVWRKFREPLDLAHLTPRLTPKRIVASSYEYEFQRSWKNEIWHVLEPVSFDLLDAGSMLDKANRWVGRATNLMDSPESFGIHMILGEPSDHRLAATFIKAQNMLNKMPGRKEFLRESEAKSFAEDLASEVESHSRG